MNRIIFFVPIMLTLIFSLAGCAPDAGGPGPRTWIDAPLDGSTVDLGPVVVRSHAASDGGTARAALFVDGAQVRVDEAGDASAALIEFAQVWAPAVPGEYTLQVITTDHAGNEGRSNSVRVRVGELAGTETPTPTPPTLTPTTTPIGLPSFTFNSDANCREGDSIAYDVVTAFLQGTRVTIEGRNGDSSWFWVLIPNDGGHCWVSGATGTPQGPYGSVAVVVPPPPPATETVAPAQPPAAPGNLHVAGEVCNAQEYKVTLEWGNVSGEDGYRVYRDGQLVATLGANDTSYTDTPPNYNAHGYGVEAFNDAGASARPTVQEDGCLF